MLYKVTLSRFTGHALVTHVWASRWSTSNMTIRRSMKKNLETVTGRRRSNYFWVKRKKCFTLFVEIQTPRCTLSQKFQWTRDKSQTSETPLTKYPQKDLYLYIFWGVLKDFPIQTISFFPISNLLPISIIYIWLKVFITMFSWRGCWRLLPHVDQKCAKK